MSLRRPGGTRLAHPQFIRIGYYVNNEYSLPEMNESVPAVHDYSLIKRSLLADKPRVTRYKISWYLSSFNSIRDGGAVDVQPVVGQQSNQQYEMQEPQVMQ